MNKAIGPQPTGQTVFFKKGTPIYKYQTVYAEMGCVPQNKLLKSNEVLEENYSKELLNWDKEYCTINNEGGVYAKYLKISDGTIKGTISLNHLSYKFNTNDNFRTFILAGILLIIITIIGFIWYKHKHK